MTLLRRAGVRGVVLIAAAAALVTTATGPGAVADVFGVHRAPAPPPPSVGFLPEAMPVKVVSPTVRVVNLTKVANGQSLRLADGSTSPPDTVYLRADLIELDKLSLTQNRPGQSKFALTNAGVGQQAALVGNRAISSVVELWAKVNSLKICLTAETFVTVATTYAGVFGGRLDQVLKLIADIFGQFTGGPFGRFGPCIPLQALLPLLQVFVDNGVPLPKILPVADLDADIYALKVTTGPNDLAVSAPRGRLEVAPG